MQNTYQFISDKGVFSLPGAADYSDLYFPVAGECGIKSAVTPTLGGDCKLDQNTFLLEPVSWRIFIITGMPEISGAISERTEAGPPRAIRRKKSQKNLRILRMKTK